MHVNKLIEKIVILCTYKHQTDHFKSFFFLNWHLHRKNKTAGFSAKNADFFLCCNISFLSVAIHLQVGLILFSIDMVFIVSNLYDVWHAIEI